MTGKTEVVARMQTTYTFYALLLGALALTGHCRDERKVNIVYLGDKLKEGVSALSVHHSILEEVIESSSAKENLVYSYGRSFNGFAAKLTDDEVAKIEAMDSVVSVYPNEILSLHTTKSWDFMGMPRGGGPIRFPAESDVIIGLLDTGIWPESASFSDKGMSPLPAKWKGACDANFTCNNKIIGARYYNSFGSYDSTDFKSPRDSEGHGTHTSSTAAGIEVPGTSFFGLAFGTARGAVPSARIAMYKVCWSTGCSTADILAGYDDAIADGVDILSVSLGGGPRQHFRDPNAIGSFHAMKKGIVTALSGGNSGPYPRSISNNAPWALTVAASTISRKFIAKVVLGNGQTIIGNSINSFTLGGPDNQFPLIYGGAAPNVSAGTSGEYSKSCETYSLNSYQVKDTIVLCDTLGASGVLIANGLGAIMTDTYYPDLAFSYPLPATVITVEDGAKILKYIQTTSNPIATILHGETVEDEMAPTVASFSSRGPNSVDRDILKPDLTAPGVDILAAWSPVSAPSGSKVDKRSVNYNVVSGTSMSCPHVSGVAAYIKSAHPDWSPAAIKSALMTTAAIMNPMKNKDAEFAYGAGHMDPLRALDPGLVFDATEKDYVEFLCNQGYNTSTVRLIAGNSSTCSNGTATGKAWDLNYPSFALAIPDNQPIYGLFHRTVTNVGSPNSTYYATVGASDASVSITVKPLVLSFSSVGEAKSFTVEVTGSVIVQRAVISGHIEWTDETHTVRTPLAIYTVLPSSNPKPTPSGRPEFSKGSSSQHMNGILHHK